LHDHHWSGIIAVLLVFRGHSSRRRCSSALHDVDWQSCRSG
jgi:hypothetical protein